MPKVQFDANNTVSVSCYDCFNRKCLNDLPHSLPSALCAMANLEILTSHKQTSPRGYHLVFDKYGRRNKLSSIAFPVGFTMRISKLFHNIPVRRKELENNIKREFSKAVEVVQAYACINTTTRFYLFKQNDRKWVFPFHLISR